jgi:hypothetical protein
MDLDQLIKQRDQMVAEAEKMLQGKGAAAALDRPIEIQEAQASRVEGRIASLEAVKADLAKSIDTELKDLKADLDQRRRKIDLDRKELAKSSASGRNSAPSERTPARSPTPPAGRKTAKPATGRKPGAASKATKGAATQRSPKGKGRTNG